MFGAEKMRIVLLSYAFYDYTIQLANSLSKANSVLLILPRSTPRLNLGILNSNVTLHLMQKFGFCDPRNLLIYHQTMNMINTYKPEAVHFQFNFRWMFFLPILRKYPSVVTIHDVVPHLGTSFLNSRFQRFNVFLMSRFFNQIIVNGETLKEQLISEYSIPRKKINAVPIWGHNVQIIKKYSESTYSEKGKTVLFFGNISKYKGVEYLIKAEPLISRELPGTKIVIAGKGKYFEVCKKLIVNRDNFEIHNHYINDKKAADLFQNCSLVVLPYIDASQSGVVPLAYAFKKPVIATNVGCLPEIVDDGKTGYIVPPKDPDTLAQKIIKLLKNEGLRELMGENAYRKLETDLSCDSISKQITAVYRKCLES
jgi:alpha-maltose-1-phosphate synthase